MIMLADRECGIESCMGLPRINLEMYEALLHRCRMPRLAACRRRAAIGTYLAEKSRSKLVPSGGAAEICHENRLAQSRE